MLTLATPRSFSFLRTVWSHGWLDLPPFDWDDERGVLRRVLTLGPGMHAQTEIREGRRGSIRVRFVTHPGASGPFPGRAEREVARRSIRHMFRLDEPFGRFHALCRRVDGFGWIARVKAGPLLRAPDPFEDLVKLICTTNCSWALTRTMVSRLVEHLGEPAWPGGPASFPSAARMAAAPLRFFATTMRAGYRAPYLKDLSERVAAGTLRPSRWLDPERPTAGILAELGDVRGAGRYVAENMLKLLGRYEGLGLDSWCRREFSRIHRNSRHVSDRTIERFYAPFGRWRGLALWCDVTRCWFNADGSVAVDLRQGKF